MLTKEFKIEEMNTEIEDITDVSLREMEFSDYFKKGLVKLAEQHTVPLEYIRVKITQDKTFFFSLNYAVFNGQTKIAETNLADLFNLTPPIALIANSKLEGIFKKISQKYSIPTKSLGIKISIEDDEPLLWVFNGVLPLSEEQEGELNLNEI